MHGPVPCRTSPADDERRSACLQSASAEPSVPGPCRGAAPTPKAESSAALRGHSASAAQAAVEVARATPIPGDGASPRPNGSITSRRRGGLVGDKADPSAPSSTAEWQSKARRAASSRIVRA